jgi:FtsP/CotA-like multicopper oxidase with cupredoxin domain
MTRVMERLPLRRWVTRRGALGTGLFGALGLAQLASWRSGHSPPAAHAAQADAAPVPRAVPHAHLPSMMNRTVGIIDPARNGFDPHKVLSDWDTGKVERNPDGRTVRSFDIVAADKEIEIAPGLIFPAWTYNGRVPGPTIRVTEGDIVRVRFTNGGSHPHSMHFHGIHAARMDGVTGAGVVAPGEQFVYEFEAKPFGCHLYHCHALPLKRHIHKGLYGTFIIDPDPTRHAEHEKAARSRLLGTEENRLWQEFVLVMNAFDTNFDNENEVYAVNTVAFAYFEKPIRVERARPVRIYLVNLTEFDPINSLHLHANFFDYYEQGTTLVPTLRTVDTVMLCQAQRGILELSFADHEPGLYMFHAHVSEFAELGWMSHFEVV